MVQPSDILDAAARPDHSPTPALRTSHFPDPPNTSLNQLPQPRLDTEGRH